MGMIQGKGCTAVDARIVARMQELVVSRTDESLTNQFGISYNTWRKLMAGQTIRASVADRLVKRIHQLEQQDAPRR